MRMHSKLLSLLPMTFMLSSCIFFRDDGSWEKEFGTPELLLENAYPKARVYLNGEDSKAGAVSFLDEDKAINQAIKDSGPFAAVTERQPGSCRYFTYEANWVPATSGPNYERLSIWEDGFVRIHHKTSLGPHVYRYFTMDEAKALALTDFAFSSVPESADTSFAAI